MNQVFTGRPAADLETWAMVRKPPDVSGPTERHRVILADCRTMPELDDRSVHLVVTSPPYWSIKDYGPDGQIGFGQSFEAYIDDLATVVGECHRVLHPGCRAAVNIGDQYLRAADHGRYRVQPIPAALTMRAMALGFDFMGAILWKKISSTRTSGGGAWMGSIYYPRDGQITYEHEYVLLFRKQGKGPRPSPEDKEKSRLTKEERQGWFRGVWEIPPIRQAGHIAMFPVELPRRLIKMYTFHGETVLDPFMGSGSTAAAAQEMGRHSVGYEMDGSLEPMIRDKVGAPVRFETRKAN